MEVCAYCERGFYQYARYSRHLSDVHGLTRAAAESIATRAWERRLQASRRGESEGGE